jgi:hypothetical protein
MNTSPVLSNVDSLLTFFFALKEITGPISGDKEGHRDIGYCYKDHLNQIENRAIDNLEDLTDFIKKVKFGQWVTLDILINFNHSTPTEEYFRTYRQKLRNIEQFILDGLVDLISKNPRLDASVELSRDSYTDEPSRGLACSVLITFNPKS